MGRWGWVPTSRVPRHRENVLSEPPTSLPLPSELLLRASLTDPPTWEGLFPTRLPQVPIPEPPHSPTWVPTIPPSLCAPPTSSGAPVGHTRPCNKAPSPVLLKEPPPHFSASGPPHVPVLWLGDQLAPLRSQVSTLPPSPSVLRSGVESATPSRYLGSILHGLPSCVTAASSQRLCLHFPVCERGGNNAPGLLRGLSQYSGCQNTQHTRAVLTLPGGAQEQRARLGLVPQLTALQGLAGGWGTARTAS